MKATELRIGNYVDILTHDGLPHELSVTGLTEDGKIWFVKNPTSDICAFSQSQVKPIPLTEEWLKRLGFEIKKGAWGTSAEIRVGRVRYVLYQNGNVWSINPTDGYRVDFKYIHTVQNHYFALTGQELNQNK